MLSAGDVVKIGVRLEGGALGVDVGGGVEGLLSETAEELSRRGQQQVDAELGRRLEARRPKLLFIRNGTNDLQAVSIPTV